MASYLPASALPSNIGLGNLVLPKPGQGLQTTYGSGTTLPQPTKAVAGASTSSSTNKSQPKPTTTTTSNNSNNNSNLSLRQQMEQGKIPWDDNLLNSGGGNNGIDDGMLDSMYNPVFAALDQAIGVANSNADLSMENVGLAKEGQLRDLSLEEQKAITKFDKEKQDLATNRQSVYEQQLRAFNASKQNANARFGGGSSAGEFVSDLSRQEFFRNQRSIEQNYSTGMDTVLGKVSDFTSQLVNMKQKIEENTTSALNSIRQELQNNLLQIAQTRAETESQKTARKMASLEKAQDLTRQVNLMKQQAEISLNSQKEQFMFMMQNNLVPTYSQANNTSIYNPSTSKLSAGTGTSQGNLTPRMNPSTGKFDFYDEFGNLVS